MQPDPDPVDLASEVSPLLQALMGHWSQAAGVRALLIKGEIANQLRLRPTRGSIDADLWVSPDEFAQFSAFLESRGWAAPERVDSAIDLGDALVDQHSVTHRHPAWPAEVDVHRLFPGFLADPQQVFEVLWQRRQRHPIAHQEVWGPDPAGAALVQALHHLRAPDHAGHKWEFEQLVTEVSSWGQSRLSELAQLATLVGAAESAAGFLELVGAAVSGPASDPASSSASSSEVALERWRVATSGRGLTGLSAAYSLRQATWRERPGLLWRQIWFTPELLQARSPELFTGDTRFPVARARIRRWVSAARDLPRVLRISRRPR